MSKPYPFILVPNALLARFAAWKLGSRKAAIVLGKRIFLHNITTEEFQQSPRLMRHELKHVEQYKRYGLLKFLCLYGWYSLRYGYYRNPLEVEARAAEEVE